MFPPPNITSYHVTLYDMLTIFTSGKTDKKHAKNDNNIFSLSKSSAMCHATTQRTFKIRIERFTIALSSSVE